MYKTCHTEESSRRQRQLEQGLLEALSRQSYEKITLMELCRELQVPRKTFYRYFPTKEDCLLSLIDHTLSDCNETALQGWDGSGALSADVLLRFFVYWKTQTPLLDAIRDNDFPRLFLDRTTVIVDRMKESAHPSGFARDQVEYFVAHGLMSTVLRWHYYGFQSSPEELAEIFGKLLSGADISMGRLLL